VRLAAGIERAYDGYQTEKSKLTTDPSPPNIRKNLKKISNGSTKNSVAKSG
jgi:hypothetical protein